MAYSLMMEIFLISKCQRQVRYRSILIVIVTDSRVFPRVAKSVLGFSKVTEAF